MGNTHASNHDDSSKGMWQPIKYRFKYLPVHIALLHTGKVLAFGGSGNDERYLTNPYPSEIFEPDVDSDIGEGGEHKEGRVYEISNANIDADIFCAGHTFLSDGCLLVAGGTYKYDRSIFSIPILPFSGLERSYIFDPVELRWSRMTDMSYGRWYPTCILLSDGRVLVMAGLTKRFPWVFLNKLEIYSKDKGWQRIRGADRWIPMYPRLHLLPSGDVFYAGSYNTHYTFPFSLRSFPSASFNINNNKWTTIGLPGNIKREEGTSVLLPLLPPDYTARVLLIAGGLQPGTEAINHVEIIDFSENPPHYKPKTSLTHARYYCYAVLLPDQQVLVLGGKMGTKSHHVSHDDSKQKRKKKKIKLEHMHEHGYNISDDHIRENQDYVVPQEPLAVREPEIYNLKEDKWYPMAHMKLDRLYHANALLLPDGRVMAAGSNPKRGVNELCIELFCPPYLFRGDRPTISRHPGYISYGHEFEIETDAANEIQAVALMHPSVNTHCVDTEQRYLGLNFSNKNSNRLIANVPSNRNLAPPGYYMLFIIKENNIPSVASFVLLN
jgi:hypothetical protein